MADEITDYLDKKGKVSGRTLKSSVHEFGLWHQTAHVWVYNSKGEVLVQRRSKKKNYFPGLWDISAAGHFLSGESPQQAAVRETFEEIGLRIKPRSLKRVGTFKISEKQKVPSGKTELNKEVQHLFILKYDGFVSRLRMVDGEVEELKFVPLKEFTAAVSKPKLSNYVPNSKRYYSLVTAALKKAIK